MKRIRSKMIVGAYFHPFMVPLMGRLFVHLLPRQIQLTPQPATCRNRPASLSRYKAPMPPILLVRLTSQWVTLVLFRLCRLAQIAQSRERSRCWSPALGYVGEDVRGLVEEVLGLPHNVIVLTEPAAVLAFQVFRPQSFSPDCIPSSQCASSEGARAHEHSD